MDDQQRLRKGLKKGDKKIFEEIYRQYYSPLCFYCLRYVDDMEEAKEIVQSLFLKIWIRREDLVISTSINSYLYKAVRNYALNHLTQQKIRQKYIIDREHLPKYVGQNGHAKMEEEELRKIIKKAILDLPEKRRKIFELSRFEEMKYHQIAEHLAISVKTVEAQMSKSLKHLRTALKEFLPVLLILMIWFTEIFKN
jgi:RNA polymerase sigma-70 factor (ECF subfamily)